MKYQWEYRKLGDFVFNVLPQAQIKPFLLEWIKREWEIDHAEFPDQSWTLEWLGLLPRMHFDLEVLQLADIHPVVSVLLLLVRGGHIRGMDHQIVNPPTLELVMNPKAEVAGFVDAEIASPGELTVQVTH